MKRILIRSPHSPFVAPASTTVLWRDVVSSNAGNLVFPQSVARALMTDDVELEFSRLSLAMLTNPLTVRTINRNYDCCVIPFANLFRKSSMTALKMYARFIDALTIPCIIAGVGLQGKLSEDGSAPKPFDAEVTAFVHAALRKSACIGVRGDITAAYLARLGFTPDEDFSVIGCPSLFMYGSELPKPKHVQLSGNSRLSLNCAPQAPKRAHAFLKAVAQAYPDHWFVAQNTYEMHAIICGTHVSEMYPNPKRLKLPDYYPSGPGHPLIASKRVVGFTDVPSWQDYLSSVDLSCGTRIHGNITAILSGTPAFIVASDSRVLELARYHNIAHVKVSDLDKDIDAKRAAELLEGADYTQVLDGHAERFARYLDFLHRNGLETIFDHPASPTRAPFDEKMHTVEGAGPIKPLESPALRKTLGSALKLKHRLYNR